MTPEARARFHAALCAYLELDPAQVVTLAAEWLAGEDHATVTWQGRARVSSDVLVQLVVEAEHP